MEWFRSKREMRCEKCGRQVEIVDYPEMIAYHKEDVEWGIWPDHDAGEPGMLVPKEGAKPLYVGCDKEVNNEKESKTLATDRMEVFPCLLLRRIRVVGD